METLIKRIDDRPKTQWSETTSWNEGAVETEREVGWQKESECLEPAYPEKDKAQLELLNR